MPRFLLFLPLLALAAGCGSTGTLVEHDGVAYWRVHCPRRLVTVSTNVRPAAS